MSVWSPKVQDMTIPVPASGSTRSSATIGTSWPNSGTRAVPPTRWARSSSSGWTIIATQAGSSSGRVVVITRSSPGSVGASGSGSDSTAGAVPGSTSSKATSFSWELRSAPSISTCEMAVSQSGHQMAGAFWRYSRSFSYRSTNDSCETRWTRGSIVLYVRSQSIEVASDCIFCVNSASYSRQTSRVRSWNSRRENSWWRIPSSDSVSRSLAMPLSS